MLLRLHKVREDAAQDQMIVTVAMDIVVGTWRAIIMNAKSTVHLL